MILSAASLSPAAPPQPTPDLGARYLCPECGDQFEPRHWRQIFCSPSHKRLWANRAISRGAALTCLVMAARETRFGTRGDRATGKRASDDANRLMQNWRDEDRAAGRMGQAEYLRRRYRLGFEPL